MKKNCCWLLFLFLALNTRGKTLVLPIESITDSGQMSAKEFSIKNPGIDITGSIPDTEGYYIMYEHVNLIYYFGPTNNKNTADIKINELRKILSDATETRSVLKESKIELINFSYDSFNNSIDNENLVTDGISKLPSIKNDNKHSNSNSTTVLDNDAASKNVTNDNSQSNVIKDEYKKSGNNSTSNESSQTITENGKSTQPDKSTTEKSDKSFFSIIKKIFGF